MHRTLSLLAVLLSTAPALAHDNVANPAVQARMDAMKAIAADMKTLTQMSRGEISFDADTVTAKMTLIATKAGEVPALFETPESDPKSEALPAIWVSFPEFTTRAAALQKAAEAGATAADEFELGDAVANLAQTCKACHSTFKQ